MPQAQLLNPSSGVSNGKVSIMPCSLPADVQVGERLYLGVTAYAGSPPVCPSGWENLNLQVTGNAMFQVFHRVADGSEGDHVDVQLYPNPAAKIHGAFICGRVSNDDGREFPTRAQSQTPNPNPPTVNPSWGASVPSLFLVFFAWRWANQSPDGPVVDAYPQDYVNGVFAVEQGVGGVGVAMTSKEGFASSENPDSATLSGNASWVAHTIAIKSAA